MEGGKNVTDSVVRNLFELAALICLYQVNLKKRGIGDGGERKKDAVFRRYVDGCEIAGVRYNKYGEKKTKRVKMRNEK